MPATAASTARIRTTLVGSYPLPAWLAALPNAVHLRDALLVVLKTLVDSHYGARHALLMDLTEVLRQQVQPIDAAVVRVDEANLPGSPQDGPLAAEAINHVLSGVQGEKSVHLCFGNYGC